MSTELAAPGFTDLARTLLGLVFVVSLVFVTAWVLRRKAGAQGASGLGLERRLVVGRGAQLLVVRAGERRLLVGHTERGLSLLTELAPEDLDPPGGGAIVPGSRNPEGASFPSFRNLLTGALRAREDAS